MDNPSESILVSPRWGFLIFGDGYIAQLQGGLLVVDKDTGKRKAKLFLKPEDILRKRYEIKDIEINKNGQVEWQCWWDDVIVLNPIDDANRVFLYTKTYNHDETDLSQREKILQTKLDSMQRQIWTIEGDIFHLSEQLTLAKQNPAEFMSQSMDVLSKYGNQMMDFASRKTTKEGEKT